MRFSGFSARFICLCFLFKLTHIGAIETQWSPDFLIIGAQKAGTGPLQKHINLHPSIMKNAKKEIHFFDGHFELGTEWYEAQFYSRTSSCYVIGQKSPYYLFHPLVPKRVHSLYPNVKIIIILNNPINRAYSQYWMNVRNGKETLSFEEAIDKEAERLAGEERKLIKDPLYKAPNFRKFSYLARGVYAKQIKRWLKYFPREQMLIIFSSDLRNNPKLVMGNVFNFLGLPEIELEEVHTQTHDHPAMDPATRQRLVEYFRPYNRQLEELLNIKLDWDK